MALHKAFQVAVFNLAVIILLRNIQLARGKCPKHEALLHNFKPTYSLDKGETIEAWAKLIPEPWEDNRLIGSLSNTDYLTFNLTSWESSSKRQGLGVITRNVTTVIRQKERQTGDKKGPNARLIEAAEDVVFTIKGFTEDPSCLTLKAVKPVSCDGFENYSFVVPSYQRQGIFLEIYDVSDKVVKYDFLKWGCPFTVLKNEALKPPIDLYDEETFVKEVDANYVLWEQQSRGRFEYSTTMKQAGCISEAQSWEEMVKSMPGSNKPSAWSPANYRSCFEEPTDGPVSATDLQQPYEILNSSAASSHVTWKDVGIFVFTLKVIDPEFSRISMDPYQLNFHGSFCNLTAEFAVQVVGARSLEEEIPTFVVLGSSCLIIIIMVLSAYYTNVLCSD